jgi:serine/threonine protein kinase
MVVKEHFKVGSPLYMPPETLSNSLYSLKTDSFALGVSLF